MISNKNRIMQTLREVKTEINTTDLSEKTHIDISNITRYLKELEKEGLVERKVKQEGKLRFVFINLRVVNLINQKQEKITPEPLKRLHSPKTVIIQDTQTKIEEVPKDIEKKLIDLIQKEFNKLLTENFNASKVNINKEMSTSDYIRSKYLSITGKTWRGTNEGCIKDLNKYVVIKSPDFGNVMKELKERFKNGFTKPSQINS